MTRSDPTGKAYRAALVDIRGRVPDAAQAVTVHVTHLERLVARLQVERSALDSRIAELAALKTPPSSADTADLVIVTADGNPIASTSGPEIVRAAIALVEQLLEDPTADVGNITTAAAVRHGPVSGPVFSIAVHLLVDQLRPYLDATKQISGLMNNLGEQR